jgi:hypothetical protein
MAKPGIGESAGNHADDRGQNICSKRNASEPKRVVEQVERDQRYQAGEGDESPALRFHALDDPPEPGACLPSDPVRSDVTCDQESGGGPQRGTCEIEQRSPDRPKEYPAGQAKECARNEQHGSKREQGDMGDRSPKTKIAYCAFDRRRIE